MTDTTPLLLKGSGADAEPAGHELPDEELIAAAQTGSAESYGLLLARYRPLIWRLAWRISMNTEDAWDISQEVVLRVWKVLPRYRNGTNFSGWLRTIAVREALRWLKQDRAGRSEVLSMDLIGEIPSEPGSDGNGLMRMLAAEKRESIEQALRILSPQQRTAITLRFFEDLALREIAEAMECSEGSVKQHLFRALEKLRRALRKEMKP